MGNDSWNKDAKVINLVSHDVSNDKKQLELSCDYYPHQQLGLVAKYQVW
jgi:hypothetical protein